MKNMITRQNYLDGKVSHDEYYRTIATEAHISFKNSDMLPAIKAALKEGDKHLSTIPLRIWDSLTGYIGKIELQRVFKSHGDQYSIAGHVCVLKQAARDAAQEDSMTPGERK